MNNILSNNEHKLNNSELIQDSDQTWTELKLPALIEVMNIYSVMSLGRIFSQSFHSLIHNIL
jgi:ABC-type polysaccharide transport system permease subunit